MEDLGPATMAALDGGEAMALATAVVVGGMQGTQTKIGTALFELGTGVFPSHVGNDRSTKIKKNEEGKELILLR